MDHIGKDTDREVFLAKLRNIAKRNYSQTGENPRYELSAITTYNQRNGVLTIGNKSHKLKGKDMRLLQLLCLHFNEWVSPKELSFGLWGMEKNIGELKRYIGHLRQELSEDPALSIENNRYENRYILSISCKENKEPDYLVNKPNIVKFDCV